MHMKALRLIKGVGSRQRVTNERLSLFFIHILTTTSIKEGSTKVSTKSPEWVYKAIYVATNTA